MNEATDVTAAPPQAEIEVRVVRVADVASLRRSKPSEPIVALVRPDVPHDAVMARLSGADVVLPCASDAVPSADDLAAATAAARLLAHRGSVQRDIPRRAAHGIAGNASAVALMAELIERETPQRAAQLRVISDAGSEMAWNAGRAARSGSAPVEPLDVVALVRTVCRVDRSAIPVPLLDPDSVASARVLVDPVRMGTTLRELLANSRAAGSTTIMIRVREDVGRSEVELSVTDDGRGLPHSWIDGEALRPFARVGDAGGDGLGLTQAAEFAQDYGGSLDVTNRPERRGVTARIVLPAARDLNRTSAARVPGLTAANLSIFHILEGVARRVPLGESLDALVGVMEHHLPNSICSILLFDDTTGTLRHGAGRRLPLPYRHAIDGVRIGPAVGSCGTAAFTRAEVVAPEIATDPRWVDYRDVALAHGLRSCWSTPILDADGGGVLGTFAVYHGEPWAPDTSAADLVLRLTHVAGVAIGTVALYGDLVESEARFRSMFETTGVAIALVGTDGRIHEANAALAHTAKRHVVGKRLRDVLHPDDVGPVEAAMAAAVRDSMGESRPPSSALRLAISEVRVIVEGDGSPVWMALGGSLIRGQQGRPDYFCLELFDLTERRRIAQERKDRAAAEAADRAKTELLTLVSHELRTPLNAVVGFAQILAGRELEASDRRRATGHILEASRHLLQIINDLIDLTGAETGQLRPNSQRVVLDDIVHEVTAMLAALATERDVHLSASPADRRVGAWADPQRVRQVLVNLVGNAIKFTPTGGSVNVSIDGTTVVVSDTGPGIAPDQVPHLFTPFHRASDTGAEGSGLGLALSQRLAVAMGGQLAVTSGPSGTTATLRLLPVEVPARREHAEVLPMIIHSPRGRVLYLEDDFASQELLKSAVSCWPEVSVEVVESCARARERVVSAPPHLIIADVQLPDGDGWELLRTLRRSAPVMPAAIVVTAGSAARPGDMDDVDVFTKPLAIPDVLAAIGRALPERERR